jgi:hypothetical protein
MAYESERLVKFNPVMGKGHLFAPAFLQAKEKAPEAP